MCSEHRVRYLFLAGVKTNTYDKRRFHVTNRSERATEKKDVRFWSVACVVIPATTLLNANAAPLSLRQCSVLWKVFCHLFCQDDVTVLVFTILILLGVINLRKKAVVSELYREA